MSIYQFCRSDVFDTMICHFQYGMLLFPLNCLFTLLNYINVNNCNYHIATLYF